MGDSEFLARFAFLKRLGLVALAGLAMLGGGLVLPDGGLQGPLVIIGVLAIVPGFFYLMLLTLWRWKARYRGTHSDLWGGLLLIETSGWFKLVYLFRHIMPDAEATGRYRRESVERTA